MKRLFFLFGFTLLLAPILVGAQAAKTSFDQFFDSAVPGVRTAYPSSLTTGFVIQEMQRWNGHGIKLTGEDLRAAVDGDLSTLCSGHSDASGKVLILAMGSSNSDSGTCLSLQLAILSLIDSEQEAIRLSQALHSIAYGSELSISDELQHPLSLARHAQLLKRIWTNTGAGTIPWNPDWNGDLAELAGALQGEEDQWARDQAVMRYRYGYFRQIREGTPFADVGGRAGEVLQKLAEKLQITGDQTAVGEYQSQPLPGLPNVALWARKDDLGISWGYPLAFPYRYMENRGGEKFYKLDGTYAAIQGGAERTAYPYWQPAPEDRSIASPLCARTTARKGYLCSPMSLESEVCKDIEPQNSQRISLMICPQDGEQAKVTTTVSGPDICAGSFLIFQNNPEKPLTRPENPGQINPDLKNEDLANLATICNPENKVVYQHELISHACYIGACLEQSMETHTLIPGRNPTLMNESTSPWLACIRDDPRLARAVEVAREAPYPLPPYVGHELVRDYEQGYCLQAGRAPYGVLGFCSYRDEQRAERADTTPQFQLNIIVGEAEDIRTDQESYLALAASLGHRKAQDQSTEIERRIFVSLASFVRQVADLFLELKNAPLTDYACPWTGPISPPPEQ